MTGGITLAEGLATGGQAVGGGVGLLASLRFVRWGFEFLCKRMDVRANALAEKEAALEHRFNQRLKHVEIELERNREALMFLVNAVAERDPTNPALIEVSRILRGSVPFATPVDACEDVMAQLNDMPGTRDKR